MGYQVRLLGYSRRNARSAEEGGRKFVIRAGNRTLHQSAREFQNREGPTDCH